MGGEEGGQVELVDDIVDERGEAVRGDPVTDDGGIRRRVSWSYGRNVLVRIPDSRIPGTARVAITDTHS